MATFTISVVGNDVVFEPAGSGYEIVTKGTWAEYFMSRWWPTQSVAPDQANIPRRVFMATATPEQMRKVLRNWPGGYVET